MTVFGIDTSHFDGIIPDDKAARMVSEGIEFATAKLSEGVTYVDPAAGKNLGAFRRAGIKILGGYHVVRSNVSIVSQVDFCVITANRAVPWWTEEDGWFWQVDLEKWPYDKVPAAQGIEFGERLEDKTERRVVMYASRGQYGEQLKAWAPRPLWNADYPSSRQAPFRDLYPGDDFRAGWDPYSGQVPVLLQYSSAADVGGLTTCDANAFRGTFDELYQLITGGTPMTGDPITTDNIHAQVWNHGDIPPVPGSPAGTPKDSAGTALQQTRNTALSMDDKLDQILVKLSTAPVPTDGTVTVDVIRQVVRDELNATKLVAG